MDRNEIKETMREENVLSKLDNPYIVKYYESFMNEDNLCIITEYCEVNKRLFQKYFAKINHSIKRVVIWIHD